VNYFEDIGYESDLFQKLEDSKDVKPNNPEETFNENVNLINDIHHITKENKMKWTKVITKLFKGCGKGLAISLPTSAIAGDFGDPSIIAVLTALVGLFDAGLNAWKHRNTK